MHFPIPVRISQQRSTSQELDSCPRTRLYSLAPREIGSIWRESFTGYINRLGWTHHVAPRALVVQEVTPQLSDELRVSMSAHFSVFGYQGAMVLNGYSVQAQMWVSILGRLTGRTDLPFLTLPWWIGNLSSRKQLRRVPAWCPSCLAEWQENGSPIYQPLLWGLQVVTLCPRHRDFLKDRCPHCQKPQAVIAANKSRPGACTHCGGWLSAEAQDQHLQVSDDELLAWQEWVMHALEELHGASLSTGMLQWKPFFTHLADCLKEQEDFSRLSRVSGIKRELLHRWVCNDDTYTPTLETILKFCYMCDVTPLQVMKNQVSRLKQTIECETATHVPRPRSHLRRVNLQQCQTFLQAVLDGHEKPQGLRQIGKHLGYTVRQLSYHFPEECALITPLAQEYRRQRKVERLDKVREQVRQAVISVHSHGVYPSQRKLRSLLPGGLMLMSEVKEAWRATLREL